jgi:hypothetical protein
MKLAVCMNGLFRNHVKPHVGVLHKRFHEKFPTADFYYHTWTEFENTVPSQYKMNQDYFFTDPEPKLKYHPISDSKTNCKHGKWHPYKSGNLMRHKTQNGSKQILGYAMMHKNIQKEYDVVIRARWDTALDEQVDFTPYIEMAYEEGPVGFSIRGKRGPSGKDGKVKIVEKTDYDPMDDWFGYLQDALIIHKQEHFDPDYVLQLHKDENLWPAEWGWYQVMSLPYGDNIHTSCHGGAYIAR